MESTPLHWPSAIRIKTLLVSISKGPACGAEPKPRPNSRWEMSGFYAPASNLSTPVSGPGEVDEIWITFPDPQLRKSRVKKRLTAPEFLTRYARFLRPGGLIHLKSDCRHLHDYTRAVAEGNQLPIEVANTDIYGTGFADELLSIKTTYEKRFLAQRVPITYLRFRLDNRTGFDPIEFAPDEQLQG